MRNDLWDRILDCYGRVLLAVSMVMLLATIIGLLVAMIYWASESPSLTYQLQRSEWHCAQYKDVLVGKIIRTECVNLKRNNG